MNALESAEQREKEAARKLYQAEVALVQARKAHVAASDEYAEAVDALNRARNPEEYE